MGALVASCIFVIVGKCSKVEDDEEEEEEEGDENFYLARRRRRRRRRRASSTVTTTTTTTTTEVALEDLPPSYEAVMKAEGKQEQKEPKGWV